MNWKGIRSGLRKVWMIYARSEALRKARYSVPKGRLKWAVDCNRCGRQLKLSEAQVDHKVPCGSLKSLEDVGDFCTRLFDLDNMQVLCIDCHREKTAKERRKRAKSAKA